MMHGTVCALIQFIVIYICFEFEKEKKKIHFSNYEWFDECMYVFVSVASLLKNNT